MRAPQGEVLPAPQPDDVVALGQSLPARLHLGTSSWSFPGWGELVWAGGYAESALARHGLAAYAAHPLMRTVSLDRAFYRPLTASQYAALAAQAPPGFRFLVKAPALVTDAVIRAKDGRGTQANPLFLDVDTAVREFLEPAVTGLGDRAGALVFQISPLPQNWLRRQPELLERLDRLLAAWAALRQRAPQVVLAVEVRNAELITPALAEVLKAAGATYCLGLHARMPPIEEQLPMLRALWPGPTVARWNLHRRHAGAGGYDTAKDLYAPYTTLVDPDLATREALAKVVAATVAAGHQTYVTINNKAEGSAPLSVVELARAVAVRIRPPAAAA